MRSRMQCMRAEGVYFGQAPSFGKNGREASSATFLQSLELPHARHLAEHPIWTSTSMKQRHFMDKHPIRTSMSMKQRHFMDEEPTDDYLATGRCHRGACGRGHRAEDRSEGPLSHAGMPPRGLSQGMPCRSPAEASARDRFETGSRQSCHLTLPQKLFC